MKKNPNFHQLLSDLEDVREEEIEEGFLLHPGNGDFLWTDNLSLVHKLGVLVGAEHIATERSGFSCCKPAIRVKAKGIILFRE